MNMLVVLGHPRPGSLNHALAQSACDALRALGHDVVFHDLHAEGFDPALPRASFPRAFVRKRPWSGMCKNWKTPTA